VIAFFSIFFDGIKDPLSSIQSSSLSNIGELSKLMNYAIQDYIEDIIDCLKLILINPKNDVLIHRGALLVLEDILVGLGTKIIEIIPHHLVSINELLFRISTSLNIDEICVIHASNGLITLKNIIDSIVVFVENEHQSRIEKLVKFL